jgi:hypothetical protein
MDKQFVMVSIFIGGAFVFFSQFLVAIYFPLFKGKGVRGRWIFVLIAPVLTASILMTCYLLIGVPLGLVAIFVTPALKQAFDFLPYWIGFAEWIARYFTIIIWLIWGLVGILTCRFLWPRWPAFLGVLLDENNQSEKHQP